MSLKQFAERLNQELDEIGVPQRNHERIEILAKLIKLPKFKAEELLKGRITPDDSTLNLLAEEFEVKPAWLIGQSEDRE